MNQTQDGTKLKEKICKGIFHVINLYALKYNLLSQKLQNDQISQNHLTCFVPLCHLSTIINRLAPRLPLDLLTEIRFLQYSIMDPNFTLLLVARNSLSPINGQQETRKKN